MLKVEDETDNGAAFLECLEHVKTLVNPRPLTCKCVLHLTSGVKNNPFSCGDLLVTLLAIYLDEGLKSVCTVGNPTWTMEATSYFLLICTIMVNSAFNRLTYCKDTVRHDFSRVRQICFRLLENKIVWMTPDTKLMQ